jgi:hypothetical protein
MIALIRFVLAVLASPFKSKSRLEAENAVLRHQLIVLRRKLKDRARLTNNDRWFFVWMYRWRTDCVLRRYGVRMRLLTSASGTKRTNRAGL